MFLYKSHKKLDHKQTSIVGFVLAVMSILSSVVIAYGLPLILALLNRSGIYHLDIFMIVTGVVLFFSVQGLILFGFPLSYAHDKKSHMTGFQILIYSWFWILVITIIITVISLALFNEAPVSVTDLIN